MENEKPVSLDTYKPHWSRRNRATAPREKRNCIFDAACDIMLLIYVIGIWAWIFLDAFGYFM